MATLAEFVSESADTGSAVFVALHGGAGEDGRLQALLEEAGAAFSGPGSAACRLCMDKAATGAALAGLRAEGVLSAKKRVVSRGELIRAAEGGEQGARELWAALLADLAGPPAEPAAGEGEGGGAGAAAGLARLLGGAVCLKPIADGCSTGVACLRGPADLRLYAQAIASGAPQLSIPAGSRHDGDATGADDGAPSSGAPGGEGAAPSEQLRRQVRLEMPAPSPRQRFLAEPFVATDPVRVLRADGGAEALSWQGEASRFLEITAAVVRAGQQPPKTMQRARESRHGARCSRRPNRVRRWSKRTAASGASLPQSP